VRSQVSPPITVVEAVLATCASQPEFLPVMVGAGWREQAYVSAGLGASNPIEQVITEAQTVFEGEPAISMLLSIGSGHPGVIYLPSSGQADDLYRTMHQIAVDCEAKAQEIQARIDQDGVYFRFSVDQGMQREYENDMQELGWIGAQIDAYLAKVETTRKIEECVGNLGSGMKSILLKTLSTLFSAIPSHRLIHFRRHGKFQLQIYSGEAYHNDCPLQ